MQRPVEKQSPAELKNAIELAIQNMPESDKKILTYVLRGQTHSPHLMQSSEFLPDIIQKIQILSATDSQWTNSLLGKLKSSFGPACTKHAKNYAGNPYDLCQYLSLLWIKAHLDLPDHSDANPRFKKSDFFAQTTNQYIPPLQRAPTAAETANIKNELLQRLNERKFSIPETFTPWHTCEKIIGTPVAGIYTIAFDQLAKRIIDIASQCYTARRNILIYMNSVCLNHSMGMFIRTHQTYMSVVFYNPDSMSGDAKVALPIPMNESIQIQRIQELITFCGLSCRPNSDFTLICLNTNPANVLQLKPNFFVQDGLYSQCLLTIANSGDSGFYFDAVQRVLQHPSMQDRNIINAYTADKATALFFASQNGHTKLVELLTSQPAIALNGIVDDGNVPPLYIASQCGHIDIVKILASKPNIKLNAHAPHGSNPLIIASQQGHIDVVRFLVTQPRINLDACTPEGVTALIIASYLGHLEIVRILVSQSHINPNAATLESGFTALHGACENGYTEIVSLLVKKQGIDLKRSTTDGSTALSIASERGYKEIVEILSNSMKQAS